MRRVGEEREEEIEKGGIMKCWNNEWGKADGKGKGRGKGDEAGGKEREVPHIGPSKIISNNEEDVGSLGLWIAKIKFYNKKDNS
jgi:hypothetical protein